VGESEIGFSDGTKDWCRNFSGQSNLPMPREKYTSPVGSWRSGSAPALRGQTCQYRTKDPRNAPHKAAGFTGSFFSLFCGERGSVSFVDFGHGLAPSSGIYPREPKYADLSLIPGPKCVPLLLTSDTVDDELIPASNRRGIITARWSDLMTELAA